MPATTTTTHVEEHDDHHHHHHRHHHQNHEHDDLDPNHTFRDYEQRALTMAVIILLLGFFTLLGAVGFTSWAWGYTPFEWRDTDEDTSQFVLSLVISVIHVLILIIAIIAGIVAIVWFSYWICGDKPKAQHKLITLLAILFLAIAVLYIITFLIGIAFFVVRLVQDDNANDNESIYTGWFGALAGALFAFKFFGLAIGARHVCRPRGDEAEGEEVEYSRTSIRHSRHA